MDDDSMNENRKLTRAKRESAIIFAVREAVVRMSACCTAVPAVRHCEQWIAV